MIIINVYLRPATVYGVAQIFVARLKIMMKMMMVIYLDIVVQLSVMRMEL